jgi:hypothetical protein
VAKFIGKKTHGIPSSRRANNNERNFKELGLQSEYWTYLAMDKDQWWDRMNTITMFGHNHVWKIYCPCGQLAKF